MASPLALTRLNIQRPEAGIVRVVSGASVTIYDTMADGTAAVFADGTVQVGAVKSTLYADRSGVSTKANPLIADSLGVVEFYKGSGEVHVLVVATDSTKYGIPWYHVSSGGVEVEETFVNIVLSFPGTAPSDSIQVDVDRAIASMPDHATLVFPGGTYVPPTANGWLIPKTKPIRILGVGMADADSTSTNFRPFGSTAIGGAPNSRVWKVEGGSNRVRFENFLIFPAVTPTSTGTGDGIWFDCLTEQIDFCEVKKVQIWRMGRDGIRAIGSPGIYLNESEFNNIEAVACRGDGFHFEVSADLMIYNLRSIGNRLRGLYGDAVSGLLGDQLRFNGNGTDFVGVAGVDPIYAEAQLYLRSSHGWNINALDMEEFYGNTSKVGMGIENCYGGVLNNLRCFNSVPTANVIGFYGNDTNYGISLHGGAVYNVDYIVKVLSGRGNRGWIVQKPAVLASVTPCRSLMDIPQQNSGVVAGSGATGGHIVFPTIDDNAAGVTLEGSFIAGIEFPSVNGVATIGNSSLKDGWVVFDSSDGKLKLRTGGGWVVIGAQV